MGYVIKWQAECKKGNRTIVKWKRDLLFSLYNVNNFKKDSNGVKSHGSESEIALATGVHKILVDKSLWIIQYSSSVEDCVCGDFQVLVYGSG